jgi:hypothetical protein
MKQEYSTKQRSVIMELLKGSSNHVTASGVQFTKNAQYKNPTTFAWDSQDMTWTEDGVILTLYFSVSPTAAKGEYNITLTYEDGDIADGNFTPIDMAVINAVIKVG